MVFSLGGKREKIKRTEGINQYFKIGPGTLSAFHRAEGNHLKHSDTVKPLAVYQDTPFCLPGSIYLSSYVFSFINIRILTSFRFFYRLVVVYFLFVQKNSTTK